MQEKSSTAFSLTWPWGLVDGLIVYAAAWPPTGKKSNLCLKIYARLELDKTP